MNTRDIERKQEVIDALKERKHERDLQAAMMGISADPSVILEQRKLEQKIQRLYQIDMTFPHTWRRRTTDD
jgi:predicted nuclease of restriction endonuclease-like (RecB) superfamily